MRYTYRRPVVHPHYRKVRRLVAFLTVLLVIAGLVMGYVYYRSGKEKTPAPVTSKVENVTVSDNLFVTKSDYFTFSDNGKWVLKQDESSANKLVYLKYRGQEVLHELTVYVNQNPSQNEVIAARVLPVRIVNNNSFDTTTISNQCSVAFKDGEPHVQKVVSLNGTQMMCNPDNPDYVVIVGVIGGDWHINLQRSNKAPVSFVILYHDVGVGQREEDLSRVIGSFQAI